MYAQVITLWSRNRLLYMLTAYLHQVRLPSTAPPWILSRTPRVAWLGNGRHRKGTQRGGKW